jgi:hypothetical protein
MELLGEQQIKHEREKITSRVGSKQSGDLNRPSGVANYEAVGTFNLQSRPGQDEALK